MPTSLPRPLLHYVWGAGAAALGLTALISLAALQVGPPRSGSGGEGDASRLAARQVAAVERIVRELLVSKPEILVEAHRALEAKQERDKADRTEQAIAANAKALFQRSGAPMLGNALGDVTVVAFFDYNCPYCRRASEAIHEVLAKDTGVRIVVQELPILSKGSEEAARVALAAGLQGKYAPAHAAIGAVRGQVGEDAALRAVAGLGLDMERLKRDMASDAVTSELALVRSLAQQLLVEGTPFFIVGDTIVPGAPENLVDVLKAAVETVRTTGCRHCRS